MIPQVLSNDNEKRSRDPCDARGSRASFQTFARRVPKPISWERGDIEGRVPSTRCSKLNVMAIMIRAHSQTTWTRFWPFLTTHLPHMDKHGHFLDLLPMSTWTFMDPPPFLNGLEIDGVNIVHHFVITGLIFKISFPDKKWKLELLIHEFCQFCLNNVIFSIFFLSFFQYFVNVRRFRRPPTYLVWRIVDIWLTTHPPHLVHVVS